MALGVATVSRPTRAEVQAATSHPDSGSIQMGWEGFQLNWHSSPPGATTAYRTTAVARTRYVANLDQELDQAFALDPVMRLAQETAYAVRFGLSNVSALRAEFGYLPGLLRAPDSEGPVSYNPHGVIVLLGHFGGSASTALETWSCSTSHDVVGPDSGAMPDTIGATALEDIFDAWSTVISTNGTSYGFAGETWLDGIAYYRRNADGRSTTGVWERFIAPTPVSGPAGVGSQLPYQVALTVTLDGGGARRGRFGRFYLPSIVSARSDGRYAENACDELLGRVATALETVNTVLNGVTTDTTELVVASGVGDGGNRPVRTLKIGRVPDTQRRRRRDLQESYSEVPFQAIP